MGTRGKTEEIQPHSLPVKHEKCPCHAAEILTRHPTDYEQCQNEQQTVSHMGHFQSTVSYFIDLQ